MTRFYTYAPEVEYPFVLRNIKQKALINTVHEIVDIGIYDLLKPPYSHSEAKLWMWTQLKTKGWKVVPDCPDIQGEFKLNCDINTIDYSKELLTKYYDPLEKNYLAVIQGDYQDVASFEAYIKWFLRDYPRPSQIALGTVCKAAKKKVVEKTIKLMRSYFQNSWIHVFGLKMNHFSGVHKYINSWDSMSWTYPRGKGRSSAKTKAQRKLYFAEYIESAEAYTI